MKTNGCQSQSGLARWLQNFRLYIREWKLSFDLHRSKRFKKYCELRGCPNLAVLEEEYGRKVQDDIHRLQKRRAALNSKNPREKNLVGSPASFL